MSERGVFAVDRGLFDHDCFADEPFTEREAWVWLISEASWRARVRRVGRVVVDLKRGQLAASLRFLADKWQWNKDAVDRYLARLRGRDMIATDSATGINIITICNYDVYQRTSLPDATAAATEPETDLRQTCDKTEYIKNIEEKKDIRAVALATRPSDDLFDEFWKVYPKRDGANPKEPARKRFRAAVRSGADPPAIIAAARRYADECRAKQQERTPYVAQAMTWLNQQRWGDYAASNDAPVIGQVFVSAESPAFDAWNKHAGKRHPVNRNGGWYFPTEYPPGMQAA
jgi:hypothetical protein